MSWRLLVSTATVLALGCGGTAIIDPDDGTGGAGVDDDDGSGASGAATLAITTIVDVRADRMTVALGGGWSIVSFDPSLDPVGEHTLARCD